MAKATSKNTTKPTAFLNAVARLSHLFQDPFFAAAEDDGLAPDMAGIDNPKHLDGGAAEVIPATGRHVRALVEARAMSKHVPPPKGEPLDASLVPSDITAKDRPVAIGRLRKEARDEIHRLIGFLDITDDYVSRERPRGRG